MRRCSYCKNRSTRNYGDHGELCEIHYAYLGRPAKINPVEVGRCMRCGHKALNRHGDGERLIDHHVNYPLDLTVPVCDSCHQEIHNKESPEERNKRWLEKAERTNEPYEPIGTPNEQGLAIHQDYKDNKEAYGGESCPECGTTLIRPPDGMGLDNPYICPELDCRVVNPELREVRP